MTHANDNNGHDPDFEFLAHSHGFSSYEEYLAEVSDRSEPHPAEIMFYASMEELNEYLKFGTFEEIRYAKAEINDRKFNAHITLEDVAGA